MEALDLSGNHLLKELNLHYCNLQELDLRGCTGLTGLKCHGNERLSSLLLAENVPLETLYISNTQLTISGQGVNIYAYPDLKYLWVDGLGLATLDVSFFEHLTGLSCANNQLEQLDVSGNTGLTVLYCDNNSIKELNLSPNGELVQLFCSDNLLEELDLSANTKLERIDCSRNKLSHLDVSACAEQLIRLHCDGNELTDLVLGDANKLFFWLTCSDNRLTELQVDRLSLLGTLDCSNNQLSALKLPATDRLTKLFCYGNPMTELDIHACTELIGIYKNAEPNDAVQPSGTVCWRLNESFIMHADASLHIIIDAPVPVRSVTLNKPGATLTRTGKTPKPTLTLKPTVEPADADDRSVTWSSDKPAVAKVDANGKVTALKAGTATITCTARDGSGVKAACRITVKDAKVTKITLNKTKATLKVGKTLQLKVKKFTPASPLNTRVKWSSNKPKIAKVDKNGKVTALKKGKAVITCAAQDGSNKKAKCTVTVK